MRLVLVAHALLPLALIAWLIATRGVDVPYGDQWLASIDLAAKAQLGELTAADVMQPYGPHPIVPTQLVTALFARHDGWNLHHELWVSPLLALLLLGVLFDTARRLRPDLAWWLLVPIAWLVFSPRQVRNWLWSFQSAWFFALLFLAVVVTVLTTRRPSWLALALAALAAAGASVSILPGLLAWPLGLLAMLLRGEHRRRHQLAWIGLAAISAVAFLAFFPPLRGARDSSPLTAVAYVAAFLGNPFVAGTGTEAPLAIAVGALGLALGSANLAWNVRAGRRGDDLRARAWAAAWAAWGGYSLLAAAMTSLGRAGHFAAHAFQPLHSRYVTTSIPFWIAVVALGAAVLSDPRDRGAGRTGAALRAANLFAAALLVPLFVRAGASSLDYANWVEDLRRDCVAIVGRGGPADCLAFGSWGDEWTAGQVPLLRGHRLSLFAGDEPIPGPADLVVPTHAGAWETRPGLRQLASRWQVRGATPLVYALPLAAPVADYPHLRLRLAVSPLLGGRAGPQLTTELIGSGGRTWRWRIPVVADGRPHAYLTEIPRGVLGGRVVGLRLLPIEGGVYGDSSFELYEVRFLAAADDPPAPEDIPAPRQRRPRRPKRNRPPAAASAAPPAAPTPAP